MGPNRGPELAGVGGGFLALTYIFVGLRVYVKTCLSKGWGIDDWALIVAQIFFTTYAACALTGITHGTGKHVQDIPPASMPKALYYWWLCEIFYALTTAVIRVSIAIFLLRICVRKSHKYIIYTTMAMVIVFTVFYFFLIIFQCSPVNYFWGQYEGMQGSCMNINAVPIASIVHSVVSFTADWILGLLPVVVIWNLKMNVQTKISLGAVLSLGLFAGIATMIRIPYIKILGVTDDFLFATTDVAIWSTVEAGLGIIAAGAATLRPLFRSFYNLSTRNGTNPSHPNTKAHSRTSRWRSSRFSLGHMHKHSPNPNTDDVLDTAKQRSLLTSPEATFQFPGGNLGGQGCVVTTLRSPFGDSREDVGERMGRAKREKMGGIKIERMVEVRRGESSVTESDALSVESETLSSGERPDGHIV